MHNRETRAPRRGAKSSVRRTIQRVDAIGVEALVAGGPDELMAQRLSELTGASIGQTMLILERYCRDEHGRKHPTPLDHYIRIVVTCTRDLVGAMSASFGYPSGSDDEVDDGRDCSGEAALTSYSRANDGYDFPRRRRERINAVGRECIEVHDQMWAALHAVARKLGDAVNDDEGQDWTDALVSYMNDTDGKGHPEGLAGWLVQQVREYDSIN